MNRLKAETNCTLIKVWKAFSSTEIFIDVFAKQNKNAEYGAQRTLQLLEYKFNMNLSDARIFPCPDAKL